MAMKLMLLAFAMLAVVSEVYSTPSSFPNPYDTQWPWPNGTVVPPKMAPKYPPKPSPKPTPVPMAPPMPMPTPHIPKRCAVGCVDYCNAKKNLKSKRTCQKICSVCCQKCNVCIPKPGKIKCAKWDKVMYHGVQIMCP